MVHCDLESVGIIPLESAAHECCEPGNGCERDGCETVEGESCLSTVQTICAPSPNLEVEFCIRCLWESRLTDERLEWATEVEKQSHSALWVSDQALSASRSVILRL